ncbi:MAG TPA: HAMP domain-containing sensor histidine kinase [Longimicrobiales bacterium]|nr:HAMP domain-containing sensor histidine kinase [Longimicrobiales bacterium]
MPHGMCYLWEPDLLWLHVVSDALIGGAYLAIPPALVVLVTRARKEVPRGAAYAVRGLPHEWMFLAFSLFIVACGTTHLLAVWNVWNADYWLSGGVKVVTALASIGTAVALPPLIPRALRLVRDARAAEVRRTELEAANEELSLIRDSLQRELESATDDMQQLASEVTARRRAMQRALEDAQEARDQARAASQAKTDFMAVISHELRTPLNGIMGYSDLLTVGVAGPLNEKQLEHVGRIRLGADHLLNIIDDILTFVRSDTAPTDVHADRVRLPNLLEEVAVMLRPEADRKGIALETDADDATVISDRERLLRILGNLVTNAVKFTDHGHVRVRARTQDGRLRVLVEDSGPGIAEQDHARVFDVFWQVDQSATRRVGGTGLGLSIARRLARQLGGDVTLESEIGQGSSFILDVPVVGG